MQAKTASMGRPYHSDFLGELERAMGFEPTTPTLARLCSTPELHPRSKTAKIAMPKDATVCNQPNRSYVRAQAREGCDPQHRPYGEPFLKGHAYEAAIHGRHAFRTWRRARPLPPAVRQRGQHGCCPDRT